MSAWNRTFTASFLSDSAEWHHMAVTWSKQHDGRMRIFKDGLMMAEVGPLSAFNGNCGLSIWVLFCYMNVCTRINGLAVARIVGIGSILPFHEFYGWLEMLERPLPCSGIQTFAELDSAAAHPVRAESGTLVSSQAN